jgi:hypothetical protein
MGLNYRSGKMKKMGSDINNNKLNHQAMKSIKIIAMIGVIACLVSFQTYGQPGKPTKFTAICEDYYMPFEGLMELVYGDFVMENIFSEKLEETNVTGTGEGMDTHKMYQVSSEISYRYHGKDNLDKTMKQTILIQNEGILIVRISKLIQYKSLGGGDYEVFVEKNDVEILN